jgi:hypothetical protein
MTGEPVFNFGFTGIPKDRFVIESARCETPAVWAELHG